MIRNFSQIRAAVIGLPQLSIFFTSDDNQKIPFVYQARLING